MQRLPMNSMEKALATQAMVHKARLDRLEYKVAEVDRQLNPTTIMAALALGLVVLDIFLRVIP